MSRLLRPITFACGTPHGGALDSTASLASCAIAAGREVTMVVAAGDSYSRARRVQAGLVRAARVNRLAGRVGWRLHDSLSGATSPEIYADVPILRARDLPAAVARHHRPGGVIVANSVRRLDLERLLDLAKNTRSALVWYLREASSLAFVAELGPRADVVVANARPIAAEAARRAGRECPYVPSVITREGLHEPDTRRSVLLVNAVAAYGLQEALAVGRALPDDHVVLQESWPLSADQLAELLDQLSSLPNVEFRRRGPRSAVYRDARIMIAPHSPEAVGLNRPRVAVESQAVGVPVIAHDVPGLRSVVASPELLVPVGSGADEWVARIRRVDSEYSRFESRAREFADSEMMSPEQVWEAFCVAGHGVF
jgi:glycosyltransferase involved in cell wall biosynthesis